MWPTKFFTPDFLEPRKYHQNSILAMFHWFSKWLVLAKAKKYSHFWNFWLWKLYPDLQNHAHRHQTGIFQAWIMEHFPIFWENWINKGSFFFKPLSNFNYSTLSNKHGPTFILLTGFTPTTYPPPSLLDIEQSIIKSQLFAPSTTFIQSSRLLDSWEYLKRLYLIKSCMDAETKKFVRSCEIFHEVCH